MVESEQTSPQAKERFTERIISFCLRDGQRYKWLRRLITTHFYLWPLLIGVIITIEPSLAENTKRFFTIPFTSGDSYSKHTGDGWAIVMWVFTGLWFACALICDGIKGRRATTERKRAVEQTDAKVRQLEAILHKAPNKNIYSEYYVVYDEIDVRLKKHRYDILQGKEDTTKIYEYTFNDILKSVCKLTNLFDPRGAVSCANIMIYIHRSDNPQKIKDKIGTGNLMLFEGGKEEKFFVKGILEGDPILRYAEGKREKVKIIDLPIVTKDVDGKDILYIPGACRAIVKHANVIETTDLSQKTVYDEKELDPDIKTAAQRFFDETADKTIKSLVSFRIPYPAIPLKPLADPTRPSVLGVLNIDTDREYIIGRESDYYTTFFSLINPIVSLISGVLKEYINFKGYPTFS